MRLVAVGAVLAAVAAVCLRYFGGASLSRSPAVWTADERLAPWSGSPKWGEEWRAAAFSVVDMLPWSALSLAEVTPRQPRRAVQWWPSWRQFVVTRVGVRRRSRAAASLSC
jgi:hypothetical protein